ncbi:MAG: DNA polymerase I, partial [Candidatus Woesebacteria bacterium]|nr:DNA polymerase I [Candidatus Woesebacteria bacterium]
GNAILHRAFHAMPPLTTRMGEPINAVYGLVSMFLRVIQDLKPDAIAVAFDEKEPTFRHKEFGEYQSQRPPTADELSSQFAKARDFFKAARVPIYSMPGFEADDVIGTIADKSKEDVVIVTGDRDILQLINDKKNIKLYMPVAGLTNAKLFDEAAAKERMGVPADKIPDYKALVGDPSDNYPGVAGIGPVTAEKLLEKYDSIDHIYAHLSDIEPNIRQKLEAKKDDAKLFHRLATIVKDVPIEVDYEDMGHWKIDSPGVIKLFAEYGFKTLTERIKKVGKEIDGQKQTSLF